MICNWVNKLSTVPVFELTQISLPVFTAVSIQNALLHIFMPQKIYNSHS